MYRHATALTFPSRFEGSALPVLEAMDRGCPVVAADATALPEMVGAGGTLVDPKDSGSWTKAMVALLEDHERRESQREAARQRAAEVRAGATPERVSAAYRVAIDLAGRA
jgi:alpha-1,3-rhamnosyl/mannosyltransferase